jgi:PAS domain-containing protein
MDPEKRKERNAREKERSCRIARQIDDLRSLLGRGGVIVSKGTKSSVLAEAANYINLLQQQQIQWEMDRQALMQQMQQVGVGAQAPLHSQMAGGDTQAQQLQQIGALQQQGAAVPGQSGLPTNPLTGQPQQQPLGQQPTPNSICPDDYKFIFDNSSVGMAIASLGGAFVDCNSIFCQLSEYTREEVCSLTIFNMTSRQDLQQAFDLISQMITPTLDGNGASAASPDKLESSIVLRGAMKKHNDLGLSVSLIKGDHGIAKCFCVTLVRILSMEATRPDTVSIEMELPQVWSTKQQKNVGFGASPAYTSG